MFQKSNKFHWYFSLSSYNTSPIYWVLVLHTLRNRKTAADYLKKCPLLVYTSLVLFFPKESYQSSKNKY